MENLISKTTVVFSRPFNVPGFDETLPAGEYDIETELCSPPDHLNPKAWKASVLIHLHPRISHPGLARTLTVSLVDLDSARAQDKLSGKELSQLFLEKMLADPMVRLVMQADGVSERLLRQLYAGGRPSWSDIKTRERKTGRKTSQGLLRKVSEIRVAENEGIPTRHIPSPLSP